MLLEIVTCIIISIKNIMFKKIPSTANIYDVSLISPVICGILASFIIPFTNNNISKLTKNETKYICIYSFLNILTQTMLQVTYDNSNNIAVTSSILTLNIITTLVLESIIKQKINVTAKQLLSITLIVVGVILSK